MALTHSYVNYQPHFITITTLPPHLVGSKYCD